MSEKLDLIIIGAGIAGVNAAIYARRAGLNFALFEAKAVGGQLFYMERIDNYIGIEPGTTGRDLAQKLTAVLSQFEITPRKEKVVKAEDKKGSFLVSTAAGQYRAKAIISATGSTFKKLGLKNEIKLAGRGVSYCAVCDGFFFKNKDVAVVGGGNTAAEEALYLANFAKTVTLIHRRDKLRALDYLQKNLKDKDNIKVLFNRKPRRLKGSQCLESIVLENRQTKKEENLDVDGLFVAVGAVPSTDLFSEIVSRDEKGFIITDPVMKTSCDSLWACGDCRRRPLRQLITAASEGAIASIEAYKHLRENYLSV